MACASSRAPSRMSSRSPRASSAGASSSSACRRTSRASCCPSKSRLTARRKRSSSSSLMLPSIVSSPPTPPRRPRPSVACVHLVGLCSKELPFRLQHLRRFYRLQYHHAAGCDGAIRLDNPLVTIIKGKVGLSLYRRAHHLAELASDSSPLHSLLTVAGSRVPCRSDGQGCQRSPSGGGQGQYYRSRGCARSSGWSPRASESNRGVAGAFRESGASQILGDLHEVHREHVVA